MLKSAAELDFAVLGLCISDAALRKEAAEPLLPNSGGSHHATWRCNVSQRSRRRCNTKSRLL